MIKLIAFGFAGALIFAPTLGLAQARDAAAVVKHCVDVVNNTTPKESYMASFYREFDAYYEPTTGLVHNNAITQGAQKPLFQFYKCMSEQGMPLKRSK